MTGTADNPGAGLVNGNITNTSGVSGYFIGLPNESRTGASALLYTIYVNNDGQAGFLLGTAYATFSADAFSGAGVAVKYPAIASTSLTPATLSPGILNGSKPAVIGNVTLSNNSVFLGCASPAVCESESRYINVTFLNGQSGIIGVWGGSSTGGYYVNIDSITSFSNRRVISYKYGNNSNVALYSENLSGAVSGQDVSISGDFLYMSTLYKGATTMNHFGWYYSMYYYTSISSGTFQFIPMAFANILESSIGVYGVMGSTTGLWTGTSIPVTMIGTIFDPSAYMAISALGAYNILSGPWQSQNYRTGSGYLTNDSGGAYKGYLNTLLMLVSPNLIGTDAQALYADASGNIGFLLGNIPGTFYSAAGGFKAEGNLKRIEMATGTGIAASTFVASGTNSGAFELNTSGGTYANLLSGGPTLAIKNHVTGLDSQWLSFKDYGSVGVGRNILSGTYAGDPQGNAVFSYYRQLVGVGTPVGTESIVYTQNASAYTSGSGGYFVGGITGASADWQSATTFVFGGSVMGTFSPAVSSAGTWNAYALSSVIETAKFIDMASTDAGRTKLAALNIPAAQVGSVDLTGTRFTQTGDSMTVNMGVNFYAYSTGQTPKIFAGNVLNSSTYDRICPIGALPAAVNLTGSNGNNVSFGTNSVTFTPKVWNTTTGKWAATVSGSGTLSPSTGILINGGAAGLLNGGSGGSSGNFNGTASGTVRPGAI